MDKIPTAEEFIKNDFTHRRIDIKHVEWLMIEFAKLHVEAALKAASENAEAKYNWRQEIDKDSILNAYPLTNIK